LTLIQTYTAYVDHPSFLAEEIPPPLVVGLNTEEATNREPELGRHRLDPTLELLNGMEEELMARSFLFTDPISYRDGVGATTEAVRTMVTRLQLVAKSTREPREVSA